MVCHTIQPFAQTALLTKVHCSKRLVWFQASGFCYTMNTGSSPGFLSDILLLPWVMEILQLWFQRSRLFPRSGSSGSSCMGQLLGRANLKPHSWAWVVAELFSSPVLMPPGPALLWHPCKGPFPHNDAAGEGWIPRVLIASSSRLLREEVDQLCIAMGHQHCPRKQLRPEKSAWPLGLMQVMDMDTEYSADATLISPVHSSSLCTYQSASLPLPPLLHLLGGALRL